MSCSLATLPDTKFKDDHHFCLCIGEIKTIIRLHIWYVKLLFYNFLVSKGKKWVLFQMKTGEK